MIGQKFDWEKYYIRGKKYTMLFYQIYPVSVGWLVFHGILTFVGYLMPNSVFVSEFFKSCESSFVCKQLNSFK